MPETTRLLLNSPLGSDPFKRTDFVENWDILDASPGIYICTSTSPPTWAGAQAGRKIYETDTRRIRNWNGTAWENVENYTRGAAMSLAPTETLGKGVKKTYTVNSTYNAPRPCRLLLLGSARFSQQAAFSQNVLAQPWIDGTNADISGNPNTLQFADSGTGATGSAQMTIGLYGSRSVTAGNHSIQVRIEIGTVTNDSLYVAAFRLMVLHVE
jgi:hypothetical protein